MSFIGIRNMKRHWRAMARHCTIIYSNRAQCFKQLCRWEKVLEEANLAIKLDEENYKAFKLKGIALIENAKNSEAELVGFEEGTSQMKKAFEIFTKLDKENKLEKNSSLLVLEMSSHLRKAEKITYLKKKAIKVKKTEDIKDYIKKLIDKDNETDEAYRTAQKNVLLSEIDKNPKFDNKSTYEIPEYICCKITFDLLSQTSLTPDGITYEKSVLIEHFNKSGHFDPVTRKEIDPDRVLSNRTIEEMARQFLDINPWAFEVSETTDYLKIVF